MQGTVFTIYSKIENSSIQELDFFNVFYDCECDAVKNCMFLRDSQLV